MKFISKSEEKITNKKNNIIKLKKLELNKIGDSEMLFYKNFSWRIITRSNELYVRIWDEDNPAVKEFQSFENYEINPNLIFNANFKYYKSSQFKTVDSKLGIKDITNFIGEIEFEYLGKTIFLKLEKMVGLWLEITLMEIPLMAVVAICILIYQRKMVNV